MRIDEKLCTGCGECVPYCPVGAIMATPSGQIGVVRDECVECGCCLRSGVCLTGALLREELAWPCVLRARFSDPEARSAGKGTVGRGSPGIKTSDVVDYLREGQIAVSIDVGRPNLGARLREIDRIARAVAPLRPTFVVGNPITVLMTDPATGKLREDVLDEKVLTATLEFTLPSWQLEELVDLLRPLSQELTTVFSLGLACLADEQGNSPLPGLAAKAGVGLTPNGKLNVGLGRRPT